MSFLASMGFTGLRVLRAFSNYWKLLDVSFLGGGGVHRGEGLGIYRLRGFVRALWGLVWEGRASIITGLLFRPVLVGLCFLEPCMFGSCRARGWHAGFDT